MSQRAEFEKMGRAMRDVLRALDAYAIAYSRAYESPIGEDAVLGDAWLGALMKLRGLLDGETGSIDPGRFDEAITILAKANGFTQKEIDSAA